MVTKSAERRALDATLLGLGQAQGDLLGAPPAPAIVRTGKPGRPPGRKNNATLLAEANLADVGEAVLRNQTRLALMDPVAEAKRIIARIHKLDEDADPNTVVMRETNDKGAVTQIVTFADAVTDMVARLSTVQQTAANCALPFLKQKMATQIDLTEKLTIVVKQARMEDDGLDDATRRAALARNVTPAKPDSP